MLNGGYHFMDLAPKGRDEEGLPYSMAWLCHDRYDDEPKRSLGYVEKSMTTSETNIQKKEE